MRKAWLLASVMFVAPVWADEPKLPVAELKQIAGEVSPDHLRATITALVGFGTRHTLSSPTDSKRGIGAARRWAADQFKSMGLAVDLPAETVTGKRIPQPAEIVDVLAIQPGESEPARVVIISGHIDSRVSDVQDSEHDAPGANDDGSGVAAVIEAARVLSHRKFAATIVYAVLSGEEQGLYGGKLLAKTAKEKGWQVEAVLNNDIIGNVEGTDGRIDRDHFRLFSEGVRVGESDAEAERRRQAGGETDGASRNLARLVAELSRAVLPEFHPKMIYRADRFARGGDQLPMQEAGYPAIRLCEGVENYHRQHQDLRSENGVAYGDVLTGVDFPYLAAMTRVNAVSLANLAWAPAPPPAVKIEGAVSSDTTLSWPESAGASGYRARWRATDADSWDRQIFVVGNNIVMKGEVIDDWAFGVEAVSAKGFVSPTRFADGK